MIRKTFKWVLPVILPGFFMAGQAAFAQGVIRPGSGYRADVRHDRRVFRHDSRRIERHNLRLRADAWRFGSYSARARFDRRQLRHAQYYYIRQARDLRFDRRRALCYPWFRN
jgi:hypothetical protein